MRSWYRLGEMGAGEGHLRSDSLGRGLAEPVGTVQACNNVEVLCPHQVLAHISGDTSSLPGVSLVYPMPSRNVSLRLQGLQEKDSGSYLCSVNVQDHQGKSRGHASKTLHLQVLGKMRTFSNTSPPMGVRRVSLPVAECAGWRKGKWSDKGHVCRNWCVGGCLLVFGMSF